MWALMLHLLAWPQACEWDGHALHVDGVWHDAVADVLGDVVAEGVAQMAGEGGNGTLAGGLGLEGEACKERDTRSFR